MWVVVWAATLGLSLTTAERPAVRLANHATTPTASNPLEHDLVRSRCRQNRKPTAVLLLHAASHDAKRNGQRHLSMRSRYEDADERRLSKGGSGGRYDAAANKKKRLGVSRTEAFGGNNIRQQRLEEYVNSDYAPADPLIGKIVAGSALLAIFGLLFAAFAYYGADGLSAATYTQRSIRGM